MAVATRRRSATLPVRAGSMSMTGICRMSTVLSMSSGDAARSSDHGTFPRDAALQAIYIMTTMTNGRVPIWVKLAYSGFVVLLVPFYWVTYSPWNFLYFCDLALLITVVAVWIESSLLVSMQAVAITAP